MHELGWSQVVELLKAAPEDFRLSQQLAERCSSLTGQKISVDPIAKARVLWLGLSRGHALLKQAVEWEQPFIGRQQQPNQPGWYAGLALALCDGFQWLGAGSPFRDLGWKTADIVQAEQPCLLVRPLHHAWAPLAESSAGASQSEAMVGVLAGSATPVA